jgi:hypothetical protein
MSLAIEPDVWSLYSRPSQELWCRVGSDKTEMRVRR